MGLGPPHRHRRLALTAVAASREAPQSASRLAPRLRAGLLLAWPALAGYAMARAVGLVALWIAARDHGGLYAALTRADAKFFSAIAEHGYSHDIADKATSTAFFPLLPLLERWVSATLPISPLTAGIAIAWLSGLAAAWALFSIGNALHGRRAGVLLAILWGVLPHAVVESMPYTEALFTALAAWALVALLRRAWVAAGLLSVLAGLARPTALALIAVVMLAALIAILRGRRTVPDGPTVRWRPWFALVAAPLGWLGYVLWVGSITGRIDGWFAVQGDTWGSRFDGGSYVTSMIHRVLTKPVPFDFILVTAVLAVSVLLLVMSLADRQPWPLWLYSLGILVITLGGAGFFNAKARFLIPAFALLLPVAKRLGRAHWAVTATVLAVLAAFSAYCGVYLLVDWPYSP